MPIAVVCSACGAHNQAPEAAVGKTLKCPKCSAPIRVQAMARMIRPSVAPVVQRPAAVAVVANTVECPFCSEMILPTAKKCKHCGETLDPTLRAAEESRRMGAQSTTVVHVSQQVHQQIVAQVNPLSQSSNSFLSAFGNILWIFVGGGLVLFFEYLIAGLLLCVTVVGIPFGLQCIKLATLALMPFGKRITFKESAGGGLATIMNILWLFFGIGIALTHVFFALLCAITIILLPFATQHMKLATLALSPFGREVR